MRKIILLLLITNYCFGQSAEEINAAILKFDHSSNLDSLRENHKDWDIRIMEFDKGEPDLFKLNVGETSELSFDNRKFIFKALSERKSVASKVKYIYLDGSKLSTTEINDLRTTILKKLKKGQDFGSLAKKYTMDGNFDGNLGWYYEGNMVKKFEDEVHNHKKGDLFTIDISENNWYYVVYKEFEDKGVELKSFLIIKSGS